MWLKKGKFKASMKAPNVSIFRTDTISKDGISIELQSPDDMKSTVKMYHHEGYNRTVIEVSVTGEVREGEEKVMFFLDSKGEVSRFNY